MVERLTAEPGAILTWVRVHGGEGIFLLESVSSANLLLLQPPMCNHMNLCSRSKSRTLAEYFLFGHTEILHLLIGMDGTALVAAVLCYAGKATRINSRNEVLKIKINKNNTDLMPVLLHCIDTSNTR